MPGAAGASRAAATEGGPSEAPGRSGLAGAAREEAGLDPDGIEFGAYVNVVVHPDIEIARQLASGSLTTFARFSVMHGDVAGPVDEMQRDVLERVHSSYDMTRHTRADSAQAQTLTPEFVDGYAIVGPADQCVARLLRLAQLGLGKVIVIGSSPGADVEQARVAAALMENDVLPAMGDQ